MSERIEPTFEAPPLVEVVCGMRFRALTAFEAPHYGLFWSSIRKDFPRSRTVLPIGQQVQLTPDEPTEVTLQLNAPDMPRVWLISDDDTWLVQLQPDRFLYNWREGPSRATYPRFKKILKQYKDLFGRFEKFAIDNKLGSIQLLEVSLSYINHIKMSDVLKGYGDIGEVFPDLAWRRGNRFLTEPDALLLRTNHRMNGGNVQAVIRSAKSTAEDTPLIRFDLVAKGPMRNAEPDQVWAWYEQANTWIVDAFVDMTSKNFQRKVWRRTQ